MLIHAVFEMFHMKNIINYFYYYILRFYDYSICDTTVFPIFRRTTRFFIQKE